MYFKGPLNIGRLVQRRSRDFELERMLTRFTSTDENKAALVSTVPVRRMATSEEIAHVIAFVASENASYMTGSSIPVDGGMIAG